MTTVYRIATRLGCALLAIACVGCGTEPSAAEDGFSPAPDSPLHVETRDYDLAIGATARVTVGPWKRRSIVEPTSTAFELISATSSDPEVISTEHERSTGKAHQHFVTVQALEKGSSWLRVVGSTKPQISARQAVELVSKEPDDVDIDFGCPEDTQPPVFISDGGPLRFLVIAVDTDGEHLAGYLEQDFEVVGPNGETQAIEPEWIPAFPFAYTMFVPASAGEFAIESERFGREVPFEVVGPEAVDRLSVRIELLGTAALLVTPEIGAKNVCAQHTDTYEVDAEILTPDICTFVGQEVEQPSSRTTSMRGRIEVGARAGSGSGICKVELSYPQGDGGRGVEQTVEIEL